MRMAFESGVVILPPHVSLFSGRLSLYCCIICCVLCLFSLCEFGISSCRFVESRINWVVGLRVAVLSICVLVIFISVCKSVRCVLVSALSVVLVDCVSSR
jgi:hypothetical protein